ncbi:MAG: DEAD/DEAH box helicase [Saprospiraceae bacterium]|nr:DEAD/DEAH box helicase [Saprospiraceae bacterium]MCB9343523.1 DEAD/DEAH box helicase [Lewinellaceae bacterium]
MDFVDMGLHPDLLDGIDALNFVTATPIQEQAIPLILKGRDLIGVAQTGTGKTAAFVLPVIDLLMDEAPSKYVKALVIVPTRELALQINKAIEAYSYFTGTSSIAIYGGGTGADYAQEKTALVQGVDIVIATPGRLISHMSMGYVNFSKLRFLVLDEADRMLDMGFQPDLLRIIDITNKQRQTLLFSATMPQGVMKLAKSMLRNPETVSIALSKPAEGVQQGAYMVGDSQKLALIADILNGREGQRIIIFASTKSAVSKLFQKLRSKNFHVASVSSDLEQEEREKVMLDFRNRVVDIIVATDVISRGIDIDGIDLVLNYDIPRDAEDYVHRIGRTARAARKGEAITLVSPEEGYKFKRIEKLIGREVDKLKLPEHIGPAPTEQAPPKNRHKRPFGQHRKSNSKHSKPGEQYKSGKKRPWRGKPKPKQG